MAELKIIDQEADLRQLVREVADVAHEGQMLSIYVNLDPSEYAQATSRTSGINSAIDTAEREAPDTAWRGLLDDLRATFARSEHSLDGARGLLVYGSQDGDASIVKLQRHVEHEVAFDSSVHIRQLVHAIPTRTWCVLLCNRRSARLLVGTSNRLEEIDRFQDDVDGQHDQGGWSQARFARNIQEQVDDHVRHAGRVLFDHRHAGDFDDLLIACPAEMRGDLEAALHEDCRRVLRGWVEIDVEHPSPSEVLASMQPQMARREQDFQDRMLDRLHQNAGRGERAALGVAEVLAAARELRLETLVVNEGFSRPGMACPHGDWLDTAAGRCPTHDVPLEPCGDVVGAAIECAVRQSAHVMTIDRTDPLAPLHDDGTTRDRPQFLAVGALGSIAAVVRFDLDQGAKRTGLGS